MASLCYRRHRFPPEIIQHAIWLYLRFTLSLLRGKQDEKSASIGMRKCRRMRDEGRA